MHFLRQLFFSFSVIFLHTLAIGLAVQENSSTSADKFLAEKTGDLSLNSIRTFTFNSNAAYEILISSQHLTIENFPISPKKNGVLILNRATSVFDGQTNIFVAGKFGNSRISIPEVICFHGKIENEENSAVFLIFSCDNFLTYYETADGSRFLLASSGNSTEISLIPAFEKAGNSQSFACIEREIVDKITEKLESLEIGTKSKNIGLLSNQTLLEVNLAIETDSDFFRRTGNDPTRTATYIGSVLAMVSAILEYEAGVTIHIPYLKIWTTDNDDPYSANGNIPELLNQFQNYWQNNRSSLSRDAAILITAPGIVGNVQGITIPNSLCQPYNAFSVVGLRGNYSFPASGYTWDVFSLAHEIGHLFGAYHTHDCRWNPPLDTCVTSDDAQFSSDDACYSKPITPRKSTGTIMSYCHLINGGNEGVEMTYSLRVANYIRHQAEIFPCSHPPSKPIVKLNFPLGKEIIRANSLLQIRWTSAHIDRVGLEFSADGGASWHSIGQTNATVGELYWRVPYIRSSKLLMRIFDANNQSIADTTIATFELFAPEILVLNPSAGDKIGAGSAVPIRWQTLQSRKINVLFSTDGGASWTTLAQNISSGYFLWKSPKIDSQNSILRAIDAFDGSIFCDVPISLGFPQLSVISPDGGENWTLGSTQMIRWQSSFVSALTIEYSTDGGISWEQKSGLINASDGSTRWFIDLNIFSATSDARIRLINADLPDTVLSQKNFTLSQEILGINETQNEVFGQILTILPQPASDRAEIHCFLPAFAKKITLKICDLTGRTLKIFDLVQNFSENEIVLPLDCTKLATGVYAVIFEAETVRAAKIFVVK